MPDNVIGTIKIDAKMETRGIVQDSATLARATRSLESSISQAGKRMNASMTGYGAAMRASVRETRNARASLRELYAQAAELEKKMGEFEKQKFATQGLKDTNKELEQANKKLNELVDKVHKMHAFGTDSTKEFQKMGKDIADADSEINTLKQDYYKLMEVIKEFKANLATGTDASGKSLTDKQKSETQKALQQSETDAKLLRDQINTKVEAANKLADKYNGMINSGEWMTDARKSLQYDIDKVVEYRDKLTEAKNVMMQNEGEGFVFGDATEQFDAMAQKLSEIRGEIDTTRTAIRENLKPPYMQAWENMPRITGMISEGFGRIQNAAAGAGYALLHPFQTLDRVLGFVITKAGQAVSALAKMVGKGVVSYLKRLASEARNAAIQLAKLAANAVSSGLKRIASGAFQAAKGMLGLNKQSRRSRGNLGQSLKMVLKYAFGVRSMFFLFRRLRRAISDGFGELKKQNPAVKSAMDSLSKSASALKGSLAAAFAPIVTAIAPALTKLMDMLTNAINTIGAFFAALTGQKTVAKSIGKISDESKKATKSAKQLKKELLGFDELNVLGDKDSNSGSSGSDSGLAYKNVPIESGIKDFADRIKALWEKGDYEGLGNAIAGYINKAMDKANELISWGNVESKVRQGVTAIAGVFNGLTDPEKGVNFAKIGSTVSEGVNTILRSLDLLILAVKWGNVGAGLANFFNGLFGKQETWEAINKAITDAIDAVRQFAQAFVDTFDEGALARGILAALGDEATWTGLAKDAWNVIKKAFNKTGNFFNVLFGGTDINEEQGKLSRMLRKRPADITPEVTINDQLWKELAANLGKRMNAALGKLAELIDKVPAQDVVDAVFGWFDKLVTNAIGEGSELGGVIGGLFNKALEAVGTAIKDFYQVSKQKGQQLGAILRTIAREAFKGDTTPATIFSDALKGAFNFVQGLLDSFEPEEAAKQLIDVIENDIDWDGIADAAWNAFKTAVEKLGSFLTVLFGGEVPTEAKNAVEAVDKMWARHSGGGSTAEKSSKGMFGNLASALSSALANGLSSLKGIIESVNWTEVGKNIGEFVANVDWSKLAQTIFDLFKTVLISINDAVGGAFKEIVDNINQGSVDKMREYAPETYKEYSDEELMKLLEDAALDIDGATREENERAKAAHEKLQQLYQQAEREHTEILRQENKIEGGIDDVIAEAKERIANGESYESVRADMSPSDYTADEWAQILDALNTVITEETPIMSDEEAAKLFEELGAEITASQEESAKTWGDAFKEAWDEGHTDEDWAEMMRYAQKLVEDGKTNEEILAELAEADRPEQIAALSTAIDSLRQSLGGEAPRSKIGAKEQLEAQGDKTAKRSTRQSKLQTRQEKLLTAALKKKKDAELTVNHKINGIAEGEDKPTVDVGVKFAPEGEEPTDENTNGGLLGWLQGLFDAETLEAFINAVVQDWPGILAALGLPANATVSAVVAAALTKAWKGIKTMLGIPDGGVIDTIVTALLNGWPGILKALGLPENATISAFVKAAMQSGWNGILALLGLNKDAIISTYIELVRKGWTTFKNFLGISSMQPLVQTVVDILNGKIEGKEAYTALQNAGKTVSTSVSVAIQQAGGAISNFTQSLVEFLTGSNNQNKSGTVTVSAKNGTSDTLAKDTVETQDGVTKKVQVMPVRKPGDKIAEDTVETEDGETKGVGIKTTLADGSSLTAENAVNADGTTKTVGIIASATKIPSTVKNTVNADGTTKNVGILAKFSKDSDASAKNTVNANNTSKKVGILAKFKSKDSDAEAKKTLNADGTTKKIGVLATYNKKDSSATATEMTNGKKTQKDIIVKADINKTGDMSVKDAEKADKLKGGKATEEYTFIGEDKGYFPLQDAEAADKLKGGRPATKEYTFTGKEYTGSNAIGVQDALWADGLKGGKPATKKFTFSGSYQTGTNNITPEKAWQLSNIEDKDVKRKITFSLVVDKGNSKIKLKEDAHDKNTWTLEKAAMGGIISAGSRLIRFANGGSIMRNGRASWWNSVNKYASGTMGAHGTVFVAGENGPEIMGHVNGRTEILNKSQLADAMYGAVVSGMAQAVNALGAYIAGHMTTCTNAIVSTIASKADLVVGRLAYYEPAMANGGIMPYDVSAQIARSTQEIKTTLNDNNEDLIQAMVSALGSVGMQIVTAIQQQTLRNGAQNGASAQQVMGAINRQTLMFGTNPLKGV